VITFGRLLETIWVAVLLGAGGCLYSPAAWSPDGRECVLVVQAGDAEQIFPEGWLWDDRPFSPSSASTRRQVWVVDANRDELRLIHETTGYLTQPAWSATADSLAWLEFTHASPEVDQADGNRLVGKLDLVRQFRDGRRDVLHSEAGTWPRGLVEELASKSTAWSPDGKFIAFAWMGSSSLRVLELSTRGLVAEWPAADSPSWSPTGQWLAYFDRSLDRGIRVVAAGSWGSPTTAVRVDSLSQPVVWESMGDSFLVYRPTSAPRVRAEFGMPRRVPQVRRVLARVHVPDMSVESIGPVTGPKQREVDVIAWSLAFDEQKEKVLLASIMENSPPGFDVADIGSSSPEEFPQQRDLASDKFHESMAEDWGIGALSLSPDARRLAFRYGPNDPYAPTAIYDSQTKQLGTIAPTMAVRMRALRILTLLIAQGLSRPEKGVGIPWNGVRPMIDATNYAELGVRPKSPLALFRMPPGPNEKNRPVLKNIDAMIDEARTLVQHAPADQLTPTLARRLAEIECFIEYADHNFVAALEAADKIVRASSEKLPLDDQHSLQLVRAQSLAQIGRTQAAIWEARQLANTIEKEITEEKAASKTPSEQTKRLREEILNRIFEMESAIDTKQSAKPSER
jgi:hypothetical protein